MDLDCYSLRGLHEDFRISDWARADFSCDTVGIQRDIKDYTPLRNWTHLRDLRVWSANPSQLDIICELVGLETLSIEWLRSITSLQPLARLKNLRALRLEGTLKEASLDPIAELTNLSWLSIASLMSTAVNGGRVSFETFEPLSRLVNLEYLQLMAVRPRDGSLAPIRGLKKLKQFDVLNDFQPDEFAALAGALPDTQGIFQTPYTPLEPRNDDYDDLVRCSKCRRLKVVLTGRTRPGIICPACNAKKLEQHVANYEAIRRSYLDKL